MCPCLIFRSGPFVTGSSFSTSGSKLLPRTTVSLVHTKCVTYTHAGREEPKSHGKELKGHLNQLLPWSSEWNVQSMFKSHCVPIWCVTIGDSSPSPSFLLSLFLLKLTKDSSVKTLHCNQWKQNYCYKVLGTWLLLWRNKNPNYTCFCTKIQLPFERTKPFDWVP